MVPRELRIVLKFHTTGFIFSGIKGVESRFQVSRSQTHFQWYRGRRVQVSSYVLPRSCSVVARVRGCGTKGADSSI
jgi:hypothetical protein